MINRDPSFAIAPDSEEYQLALNIGLYPINVILDDLEDTTAQFISYVNAVPRVGEIIKSDDDVPFVVDAVVYGISKIACDDKMLKSLTASVYAIIKKD